MKRCSLFAVALVVSSLAAALHAADETSPEAPKAIIARSVQAIGGQAAIARLGAQYRKGSGHMKDEAEGFRIETYLSLPDKFMVILGEDSGAEACTHLANGSIGWVRETRAHVIRPELIEDLSYCLNPQLLVNLEKHADQLQYKGKVTVGNEDAYVLEKRLTDGRVRKYCFGVQSGLLLQAGMAFLEDYRDLDGVKLPFRLRPFNGALIVDFQQVQNGVTIDEKRFDIPSAVRDRVEAGARPASEPSLDAAFSIDW